jgi:hypothetical protein
MEYFLLGLLAIPLLIGVFGRIIFQLFAFAFNPMVVIMVILMGFFYYESLKV